MRGSTCTGDAGGSPYLSVQLIAAAFVRTVREEGDHVGQSLRGPGQELLGDNCLEVLLKATPPPIQKGWLQLLEGTLGGEAKGGRERAKLQGRENKSMIYVYLYIHNTKG